MENKLEELLNSLIEKGWKPFGRESKKHGGIYCMKTNMFEFGIKFYVDDLNGIWEFVAYEMPIRNVASKESGLWQFVCENGMVRNEKLTHNWVSQVEWGLDVYCKRKTTPKDYEYRLIESALKDDSELENFLLSNIKI